MGKKLILLIILLCSMVVNVEAQVTPAIKQKGNNVGPPGLSNIGVLPCVATAVAPVYTEGFQVGCSTDLAGTMRTTVGGGGGGGTSSTFGAAFPATGTASGWSDGTNMQGARVFDEDTGVGTQYVAGATLRCSAAGGSTECLPATAIDADGVVNQTSTYIHGMGYMYNGVTWDRIRGTIAGGLLVNISNVSLAVTGTFFQAIQPVSGTVAVSNAFLLDATFTGRINTLGQKVMAASTPVVIASDQASIPVAATVSNAFLLDTTFTGRFVGATLDADALVNETTTAVHGKCYLYNGVTWDRCRGSVANGLTVSVSNATLAVTQSGAWTTAVSNAFLLDATFTGRINTLGQKVMASSTPVVLASDQSAIPVSQSGTWNITNVSGVVSLPTGAATETTLGTRLADSTFTGRFVAATLDADAIANQTTTSIHGMGYMYNGVTWDRVRGTIAAGLLVNVSNASLAVTGSLGRTWTLASGTDSVAAVQSGVWNIGTLTSITNPVAVTGTFFQVTQPVSIAATVSIQGVKSNNAVVPGATNVGVLPCIANANAPTLIEGNQVGCSTDLNGNERVLAIPPSQTLSVVSEVNATPGTITLLASSTVRQTFMIQNQSRSTMRVKLGVGAKYNSYTTAIKPGGYWELPTNITYRGQVDAIFDVPDGVAYVTDIPGG